MIKKNSIVKGDCLELLKKIPDKYLTLIEENSFDFDYLNPFI